MIQEFIDHFFIELKYSCFLNSNIWRKQTCLFHHVIIKAEEKKR